MNGQKEAQSDKLVAIFEKVKTVFGNVKERLFALTARDGVCIAALTLIAAALRFPMLHTPAVTEFDEVIYANYALHLLDHIPFMDIHPPLVRVLFAEIVRMQPMFQTKWIPVLFGQSFGDFPFLPLRLFVACFGTLLPLIIYCIGRLLKYSPRVALLLGLFVATDNALIIYSRVMLPDILLQSFNFLALLCALIAVRSVCKGERILALLLCAIAIGLALAIKWTALGVLATICLLYLLYKRPLPIFFTGITAIAIYLVIFVFALSHYFPMGGSTDNFKADRAHPWLATIVFPKMESPHDALMYLPELHKNMLRANYDPYVISGALQSLGPQSWPIAKSAMLFWPMVSAPKQIVLTGNSVLWVMSFFVFLFDIFWILLRYFRTRILPIEKDEFVLIAGYVMNYLPFFFIHRPMYLYHYFTALLFLILLLPKVTPRIVECLGMVTRDTLFARVFVAAATLLIFVNALLLLPATFGW